MLLRSLQTFSNPALWCVCCFFFGYRCHSMFGPEKKGWFCLSADIYAMASGNPPQWDLLAWLYQRHKSDESSETITHQTMTTVVRSALILRFAGITTTHIIRDLKSVYVYSLQSRLGFIPSYFSIYTAKQTENWASFIWKAIYADKLPALKLCLPATEAPDATLHFPFMRRYLRKWTRCKSPSIHHAYIHSHEYT